MVGIVIVSHSKQLAEGVRELAAQMVQGQVPLAIAAGIDDPQNPLGTDAMQVYEAIASVYSDDGVLVLMDLGSAVMSAEMALEFLPESQRDNVYLCAAPLVEGSIAATVTAVSGGDIQQVMVQAREALLAKATHLGVADEPTSVVSSPIQEAENAKEIHVFVRNRLGLHARPAARFVSTATHFQSQILVKNLTKNTEFVRADSINQVATLGVRQGDELIISAVGDDADTALETLQALITSNFGESDTVVESPPISTPIPSSNHSHLQGIPAAAGVAIAPIVNFSQVSLTPQSTTPKVITELHSDILEQEWQKLQSALLTAQREIQTMLSHASTQIGDAEAAIFDAHLLFLEDPTILEALYERVFDQGMSAETAWQRVMEGIGSNYRTLDDPYLQERVADVVDVGQRVLRLLLGASAKEIDFSQPAILVAADLSPSDTAQLDPTKILGICITSGSPTSHSAIIARSLGIPAVVGVPPQVLDLTDGTLLALDGETGQVWIEPDADVQSSLEAKRSQQDITRQAALQIAHQPGMSRDGKHISIFANISSVKDTNVAINFGAEGVGLFRTEFLYLDRTTPPSETEQLEVYQAIAQILENRPLIIRTLDVGGDKPLPYLGLQTETNPFLGWRGIRFCLDSPEILKIQLRAILRASSGHKIKVMFPMVATVEEIQAAKVILSEVKAELRQGGIAFDEAMEVGIMVEVPSAVTIAEKLAPEVDFFSIGTNDLSQYIMACDRTNPKVANLADALHPAVLRMIQQTVQAGHAGGIWVGLCGELAAEPLAAPILLGLGLDEVSINPPGIPAFKQAIAQLTIPAAEAIVTEALKQDSAAKVRQLLAKWRQTNGFGS